MGFHQTCFDILEQAKDLNGYLDLDPILKVTALLILILIMCNLASDYLFIEAID